MEVSRQLANHEKSGESRKANSYLGVTLLQQAVTDNLKSTWVEGGLYPWKSQHDFQLQLFIQMASLKVMCPRFIAV